MKICIIGNGLVGLSLAKALVNKNIAVDVFYTKKHIKYDLGSVKKRSTIIP